jgi:hypothetical protein
LVIYSRVAAKASENINIPVVIKSGAHDVIVWIRAVQRVIIPRPVVSPLPLALGGGGEGDEKGGENCNEKFGKIQCAKS